MSVRAMLLRVFCACVLGGILVAGLWPFHTPRNDVSWASDGSGLLFGKHGSIVSASPLQSHAKLRDNSCALEIWLQPSRVDKDGMILAFYWPENRVTPFSVRQYHDGALVLESKDQGESKKFAVYVGDVFHDAKPVFVTITSGKSGMAAYVDGTLVKSDANFPLSARDLTGQLVIGSAPSTAYSWSGLMKELAIYDRELSAVEVAQNFHQWTTGGPDSARSGLVARYLFDERKGSVVRNQIDSATNLLIPDRFFILNKQFLERPWEEFRWTLGYWKDAAVNIVGFIPLGFFFYVYFSQLRRAEHSVAITIALGFAVSLTIEVTQAFLPTRDSGMTDLITNTLGTAFGVFAFRHIQARLVDNG
jgi:hypothetical protein